MSSSSSPSPSPSPNPSPSDSPPLKPTDLPGRGRALVASRPILPGEILLSESPLLLYPSSPHTSPHCSHCFRTLRTTAPPITCPSSCSFPFCSPRCHSSHTPFQCQALSRLPPTLPSPLLPPSLFLIAAYSLSLSSPPHFNLLFSLHGSPAPADAPAASTLHSLLATVLPSPPPPAFSPQLTATLLAKDKYNAFGLMEPFDGRPDRVVRAYGIYANASLFNHDCLPNACRFDYLDGGAERNTDIVVRAMHEIREGQEVCLSYFPVNWRYAERQRRLLEDYGIQCECDRCRVEKDWKDDDGDEDCEADGMEEAEVGDDGDEGMELNDEGDDGGDFPHAYFFVRCLCDSENCGGTLAPLPPTPQGVVSNILECNFCGQLRTEDETCNGSYDSEGGMADN